MELKQLQFHFRFISCCNKTAFAHSGEKEKNKPANSSKKIHHIEIILTLIFFHSYNFIL